MVFWRSQSQVWNFRPRDQKDAHSLPRKGPLRIWAEQNCAGDWRRILHRLRGQAVVWAREFLIFNSVLRSCRGLLVFSMFLHDHLGSGEIHFQHLGGRSQLHPLLFNIVHELLFGLYGEKLTLGLYLV